MVWLRGAGLLAVGENVSVKLSSYVIDGEVPLDHQGMSAWIPKLNSEL